MVSNRMVQAAATCGKYNRQINQHVKIVENSEYPDVDCYLCREHFSSNSQIVCLGDSAGGSLLVGG